MHLIERGWCEMCRFQKCLYLILREGTKKKVKKTSQQVWTMGGVSKFWCVNLKKSIFLELIFQKKTCWNWFIMSHLFVSLNSYKIMWETGVLVPFGMARGGCPSQNSNLTATNFWPNRKFDLAKHLQRNIKISISNFS